MEKQPQFARCGIGPKPKHFADLLETLPKLGFLEFHSENYFTQSFAYNQIRKLREHYEFSFHSIGCSLGSIERINKNHIAKIKALCDEFNPILVSEHLSFSQSNGIYVSDLLPVPLNDDALAIFIRNIDEMQEILGRTLLIENPSQYLDFTQNTYSQSDFLNLLCQKTGCKILLDTNNLEVCRQNIGLDPIKTLDEISIFNVGEIHLAGYKLQYTPNDETIFLDNHGAKVSQNVWQIYALAIARFGDIPSLIEWDNEVPSLQTLIHEAQLANKHKANALKVENA